jgi:hypothetical protein
LIGFAELPTATIVGNYEKSRLDVFFDQVTTPAASVWEEKGWTSFINV